MSSLKGAYIFYLKLNTQLSDSFYKLSRALNQYGLSLIPVDLQDFIELQGNEECAVIALVPELAAKKAFQRARARYLDFALNNKQVLLFHVSSFSKVEDAYRWEKEKCYHYRHLPIDVEELAYTMARALLDKSKGEKSWLWGKRAKLPLE